MPATTSTSDDGLATERYPGIKTVVKITADGMFGLDPSILKAMTVDKADGAIVGVAG